MEMIGMGPGEFGKAIFFLNLLYPRSEGAAQSQSKCYFRDQKSYFWESGSKKSMESTELTKIF